MNLDTSSLLSLAAFLGVSGGFLLSSFLRRRGPRVLNRAASRAPYSVSFVLGPPGSGKGTQCARIQDTFGHHHLSAGQLLRDEIERKSEIGLTIENIMNEGQIVPSHITVSLIKKAMERSQKRKFLIDGFPRNEENLQVWHETMDSVASIDRVLVLQVSDQTVRERIGHRRSAEGEERKDDSEAVLKKRLVTHRELCQPVIDFFLRGGSAGTDVLSVDGSGSEDEVFEELRDGFEYKVIFVLGPPGAGKGTQCNNLVSHFKGEITHLSAGDLLRAERNSGSENGELINNMIKEGQIVPAEITVNLLKRAMEENPNRRFLIDGFPRNTENLQVWEQIMQDCSETEFVLWFVANDQVVTDRLLDRGKTSGRVDDNLESIKKRLKTYTDSTIPIIQHFQARDKVREIDGSNSVEETFQRVLECF